MPENVQSASGFVGRRVELEQFEQAIKPDGNFSGLLFGPGSGVRARVFLIHGVGGIGKTWLGRECLRRAALKKWATLEIDWGSPEGLPSDQAGLMNMIAQALKLRFGEKLTQDYEQICDRARRVREGIQRFQHENPTKWRHFSSGGVDTIPDNDPLSQGVTASAGDSGQDWALGTTGKIIGARAYIPTRAEDNFIDWLMQTNQIKPEDALLFHDPHKQIATELVKILRKTAIHDPLVILLDGCQALPYALEEWLRDAIVCPLVKAGPALIFILSGRQNQAHERSVSLPDGKTISVKGYADRLAQSAPILWPLTRMSDPEIGEVLAHSGLPSETYLVDFVQSRSAGIPLAARLVIQVLQKMGGDFVRDRFFLFNTSSYSYDEIVTQVTRSFLDAWLEGENILQQVRGLALVRSDETALQAVLGLPEGYSTRETLANLARQVSFIEPGGKMLPVVREFIRHEMRLDLASGKDAIGARRLGKLATDALKPVWQVVSGDPAPLAERVALPTWRKCALEMLNNLCWSDENGALQFLAARVIESLLFDQGFAAQLLTTVEEFTNPPGWFSTSGNRLLSSLKMVTARETGSQKEPAGRTVYDFLFEKYTELGLNYQHKAILHILLAHNPIPPDPANFSLRNLLIAAGLLEADSDQSLQQALAYSLAELGWNPGQDGITMPSLGSGRTGTGTIGDTEDGLAVKNTSTDSESSVGMHQVTGEKTSSILAVLEPALSDGNLLEPEPQPVENNAAALNKLAHIYYDSNKFEDAISTYHRAIQLDPSNAQAWNGLGIVYNALNRMDDGIAAYRKAIELNPLFVAPWNGLGALFNDIKNSEQSITAYHRAIELDPADATPWNGLGNVYHAIHWNEDAIAAFNKAIKLEPRFAHPWNGLGYVYRHQNRHEDAIAAFNKAVELHPLFALPWNGLGLVYRSMGNNEQAMIAYKKAIEINPRSAIPWNGMGYIYFDLRRFDDALAAFNKAVEVDSRFAAAWNGLGKVHATLNQFSEALSASQKAVKLDPSKGSYWHGLANIHREMGSVDEAIQAYQKTVELEPDYANPWYGLGAIYGMLGQSDQAIQAFNRAIEIEPGWAYPWNGLGNVYRDLGKFEEAINAYNKTIGINPAFAAAWVGLGNIHSERLEDEKAVIAFRKALELIPSDTTLRDSLNAVLKRLGREDSAP